jgi:hypothetical protein
METPGAYSLRENTGTSGIETTLHSAVELLAEHGIPHLVAGGLAVQEHGYFRVTLDADVIVPDVIEAVELVTANLSGPFFRYQGLGDTVEDRRNGVLVNFLPAGKVLRAGCNVPFPQPTEIATKPRFITLGQLVSLKLDSWVNSPARRLKDKADVVELIKSKNLPRDLGVDPAVKTLYVETWDALQADPP